MFPPNWRFDSLSFLVGFAAAALVALFLFAQRKRIAAARDGIRAGVGNLRDSLTAGVDRRYRESLIRYLQSAHLAGSALALDSIFVPVRLLAPDPLPEVGEPPESRAADVVPNLPDWPFLPAQFGAPTLSVDEALQAGVPVVVLGRPGAGKTTLLAHQALRAALEDDSLTPILVHLGDLDIAPRRKQDPAEPLIAAAALRLGLGASELLGYLREHLRDGRCLVVLDGWDDLPAAHRREVMPWLTAFLAKYGRNRIAATGPLEGYAPLAAAGFAVLPLAGWTPGDFRALIRRWVEAWSAMLETQPQPAAAPVEPALIAGWLTGRNRARTPFEVTLRVWTALEGDLRGARSVDWVAAYVDRLLPRPEIRRALEQAAVDLLVGDRYGLSAEKVVGHVGKALPALKGRVTIGPADYVDDLLAAGGLLVRRAANRVTFVHPAVAGHLAAASLVGGERAETLVAGHADLAWSAAMPAFFSLGDPTAVVAERLRTNGDPLRLGALAVAAWMGDAPKEAIWRGEVFRRLAQVLLAPNQPAPLRSRALAALLATRDEGVVHLFKQGMASPDVTARRLAALGLGATGDPGATPVLQSALGDQARAVRFAAVLGLSGVADSAAVESLARLLVEGEEAMQVAAAEALALLPHQGHSILREGLADEDLRVRRACVFGVKRIGPASWVIEALKGLQLNDAEWFVRNAAAEALAELEAPTHPVRPTPPAEQMPWLVEWAARRGEGVAPGAPARNALLRALSSGEPPVRIAAARSLGRLHDAAALDALKTAAADTSPEIRDAAVEALYEILLATAGTL